MITIYHVMDLIRTLYWGVMWVVLAGVLFLIMKVVQAGGWKRLAAMAAALIAIPGAFYVLPRLSIWAEQNTSEAREARTRYETAKAIFDERCKQAGEKIYRTASEVEGITLLNVYPESVSSSKYNPEQDPMWPGAALPQQIGEDSYINSFLGWSQKYEHNLEFSPNYSLLIKPKYHPKTNLHPYPTIPYKNYAFVDVVRENNHFSRYQLYPEAEMTSDHYMFHQELKGIQETSRYAVRYESIVEPQDRQHWVAGAKVSIIDQENQEVMASKTWYAFAPSLAPMRNGPTAWRHAMHCPKDGDYRDVVVKFVVTVIQPKQEE